MASPDVAPRQTIHLFDAERQVATMLAKFAADMSYVDDMDAEDRSEVYAILRALEDDLQATRDQLTTLKIALESEGVHCA